MPSKNGQDNIATALGEVSDKLSKLIQDEIELAKAEVGAKVSSIMRGAAAVAAGAVFGIFAVIIGLATLAWGLNSLLNSIWLGFLITFIVLLALTVGAFIFAWKKLRVGAPTPKLAIDEGRKIKDTVVGFGATAQTNGHARNGRAALPTPPRPAYRPAPVTPAPVTPVPAAVAAPAPVAEPVQPSPAPVVTPDPVREPEPAPAQPAATSAWEMEPTEPAAETKVHEGPAAAAPAPAPTHVPAAPEPDSPLAPVDEGDAPELINREQPTSEVPVVSPPTEGESGWTIEQVKDESNSDSGANN